MINIPKKTDQDIERLKILMETIEKDLLSFKDKQRTIYDSLIAEEQSLSQEMKILEAQINEISISRDSPSIIPLNNYQKSPILSSLKKRNVPDEVLELEVIHFL